MGKVVIKSKVGLLRILSGRAVGPGVIYAKCLLHSEHRFKTPHKTYRPCFVVKRPIIRLKPISVRVCAPHCFRSQPESSILGLPPQMHAAEVFMFALQKTSVRRANFKTLHWKIEAPAAA